MLRKISQRWRLIAVTCFLMSAACIYFPRAAIAETVIVDSKAAGKFGAYGRIVDEESRDLVKVYVFTAPGKVTLKSEGKVTLLPGVVRLSQVGPKGVNIQRGEGCYLPLEEALVDAKGTDALGGLMRDVGALFGAYVKASTVNSPGFRPMNNDFPNGGISSDQLFLVGAGLDFSAEEPGTLFLGINDCRPSNNIGFFSVSISNG